VVNCFLQVLEDSLGILNIVSELPHVLQVSLPSYLDQGLLALVPTRVHQGVFGVDHVEVYVLPRLSDQEGAYQF